MSATQTAPPTTVELGRYRVTGGERVLVGRRTEYGEVEVYDCCAKRTGRSYLVERGFSSFRELAGEIADYKARALEIGDVPMKPGATKRHLAELERLHGGDGR